LTSILEIQSSLHSNKTLSEIERRKNISDSLRDEYVLTHNPVDPEILAGSKMPPKEWMNKRLTEMGEPWKIAYDGPASKPGLMQQIASEPKRATVVFSFKQDIVTPDNLTTTKEDPMRDGRASVSIVAMAIGDTPAEDLQIWIRKCADCEWISPNPKEFFEPDPDRPDDRSIRIPLLPPNVIAGWGGGWGFTIQTPLFPKYNAMGIGCYYACKNCPAVDWNRPQMLWVKQPLLRFRMQSPPILYAPAPIRK
jgi:hypothetical protein